MFRDVSIDSDCMSIFLNGVLTISLNISHIFVKQFVGYLSFLVVEVVAVVIVLYNFDWLHEDY